MRYAYDRDVMGFSSNVMFFFEKGDERIANGTIRVLVASKKLPTSLVWEGVPLTPTEALLIIQNTSALDQGYLGVRFMFDSDRLLLKSYLDFLRENYPVLYPMIADVEKVLS